MSCRACPCRCAAGNVVPLPRPEPVTIVHANLLFDNIRIADVAGTLARLDADILTFSEYTPHHARVLHSTPLAAAYPYRIEMPAALASGTALWSRHPVTPDDPPATRHHTVVGHVDGPGGPVCVVVVHAQSPVIHSRPVVGRPRRAGAGRADAPGRDDR